MVNCFRVSGHAPSFGLFICLFASFILVRLFTLDFLLSSTHTKLVDIITAIK